MRVVKAAALAFVKDVNIVATITADMNARTLAISRLHRDDETALIIWDVLGRPV